MLVNLNNQEIPRTHAAPGTESTTPGTHTNITPALHEMMNTMLKVLGSAKAEVGKTSSPSKPNGSLIDNMGMMMAILANIQGVIAKLSQSRGENDSTLSTAMLGVAEANVKAAAAAYDKLVEAQDAQAKESAWMKFWECLVAAVVAIIACVAGQPQLAAMVILLTILSVSGAMSAAVKAIATELVKLGMSKEAANVVASVIMVVVVIAATLLTSGAASYASVAEVATTATAEAGATATNFVSKFINLLIEYNPFNKLPGWLNTAILGAAQGITSTNLISNAITLGFKENPLEDKEKQKKLILALNILVSILVGLISVMAGAGASQTTSTLNNSTKLGKLLTEFNTWAKGFSHLQSGLQAGLGLAGLGQGLTQMSTAITQSDIAEIQRKIGNSKGITELLNSIMNTVNNDSRANTENANTSLTNHSESMASVQRALNEMCSEISNLMTQFK